eukprot:352100-Chlamydomonas_euryale.AAC.5
MCAQTDKSWPLGGADVFDTSISLQVIFDCLLRLTLAYPIGSAPCDSDSDGSPVGSSVDEACINLGALREAISMPEQPPPPRPPSSSILPSSARHFYHLQQFWLAYFGLRGLIKVRAHPSQNPLTATPDPDRPLTAHCPAHCANTHVRIQHFRAWSEGELPIGTRRRGGQHAAGGLETGNGAAPSILTMAAATAYGATKHRSVGSIARALHQWYVQQHQLHS